MRTLAIDFGEKRIGLAVSDDDGRLAVPLDTIHRRSDKAAVARIGELAEQHGVGRFVVGEPLNVDGSRGAPAERAASFAKKLAKGTGLPVEMVVETLTTVAARERLEGSGVDLRRHPERLDAVAAQILLEEFLGREDGA